jgi:hypothetical protein
MLWVVKPDYVYGLIWCDLLLIIYVSHLQILYFPNLVGSKLCGLWITFSAKCLAVRFWNVDFWSWQIMFGQILGASFNDDNENKHFLHSKDEIENKHINMYFVFQLSCFLASCLVMMLLKLFFFFDNLKEMFIHLVIC